MPQTVLRAHWKLSCQPLPPILDCKQVLGFQNRKYQLGLLLFLVASLPCSPSSTQGQVLQRALGRETLGAGAPGRGRGQRTVRHDCSLACLLCTRHMGFEKGSIRQERKGCHRQCELATRALEKGTLEITISGSEKRTFCFPFDMV